MCAFHDTLAQVRRRFPAAEIRLLASSVTGREVDAASFADRLRKDAASNGDLVSIIAKLNANEQQVSADYLFHELESMPAEMLKVLLAQLDYWQPLLVDEALAPNHLPLIYTLQRMGLIEPANVAVSAREDSTVQFVGILKCSSNQTTKMVAGAARRRFARGG